MATLNMNLNLPSVGVTTGPTYATQLNQAFTDIDTHDHTSGKGVQVPTAGININADLAFNSYGITSLKFLGLVTQATAPTTNKSVYVNNSNDLYYKNSSGVSVQITNGSVLNNATAGFITYKSIGAYPYTAVVGDAQKILGVDTSTTRTINLPSAANNMWLGIKDITGSANTNNITVDADGSDLIDGLGTHTIDEDSASRILVSDGVSKWFVV